MIFNKFLLGLPPTKVNIDSELFSLGLTREMLTREIIKFCIHYIFARLYICISSGEPLPEATNKTTNAAGLTPEQVKHIKMMIAKAGSLEEIERLNMMLRNGQMPGTIFGLVLGKGCFLRKKVFIE